MNGKRILITGGAGFVGSQLVKRLCPLGATVTVLDDLFTGQLDSLAGLEYSFVLGSVCNQHTVNALARNADIIFHCAVRCLIASTGDPVTDFETNIGGTLNVLLAAREFGAKVIYTSSVSIYGNQALIPTPEDSTPDLLTPYAVSKYAGEGYCKAFGEVYGVPVSVVRLSNCYGPGQDPRNPYCGVVSKFMMSMMRGEPMTIFGDGEQTRDYTYIDDAVDAIIEAATNPRAVGEVFNVGTDRETSVNQLAEEIIKLNGSYSRPTYAKNRDIDTVRRRAVNPDKARRVLRWTPKIPLLYGLIKTYEWIKAQ